MKKFISGNILVIYNFSNKLSIYFLIKYIYICITFFKNQKGNKLMATKKKSAEQLRTEALRLIKRSKLSSEEIAKRIGTSRQRVAAWRAWVTMGKY